MTDVTPSKTPRTDKWRKERAARWKKVNTWDEEAGAQAETISADVADALLASIETDLSAAKAERDALQQEADLIFAYVDTEWVKRSLVQLGISGPDGEEGLRGDLVKWTAMIAKDAILRAEELQRLLDDARAAASQGREDALEEAAKLCDEFYDCSGPYLGEKIRALKGVADAQGAG